MSGLPAVVHIGADVYFFPTQEDKEQYDRICQSFCTTHDDVIPSVLAFRKQAGVGHMPDRGLLARLCAEEEA